MNEYKCQYCGVECSTIKAKEGHEGLCSKNPKNIVAKPDKVLPTKKE
jgi:hypothetical protein